jgi:hypothetical protein
MATDHSKEYAVEAVDESHSDRLENGIALSDTSILGGTETDHHEMRILGRIQQLNV